MKQMTNWMRRVHGWQRADRETICAPGGVVLRTIVHHPWSPKRGRR